MTGRNAGGRGCLRVSIRVRPGSARPAVGGTHAGALVVAVAARPVEGAATRAVLVAVADAFGVRRQDVRLVTGAASRDKVVEVTGDEAALREILARLVQRGGPEAPDTP